MKRLFAIFVSFTLLLGLRQSCTATGPVPALWYDFFLFRQFIRRQ